MEKEERVAWIGQRALELFRGKQYGLSDRLVRHGLLPSVAIEIAACVNEAMWEFCKENPKVSWGSTRALLETEIFKEKSTTGKASEQARARIEEGILGL